MTECLCPSCSTLPLPSHTEQHRRECEARVLLRWSKTRREKYYRVVRATRGKMAASELIREVKEQWRKSQSPGLI